MSLRHGMSFSASFLNIIFEPSARCRLLQFPVTLNLSDVEYLHTLFSGYGADFERKDAFGRDILFYSVIFGLHDVTIKLLNSGYFDLLHQDIEGRTILFHAGMSSFTEGSFIRSFLRPIFNRFIYNGASLYNIPYCISPKQK